MTATETTFSLSMLARGIAREHRSADYHDWVDDLLAGIPEGERDIAVRAMALEYLRHIASTIRHDAVGKKPTSDGTWNQSRWPAAASVYKGILAQPLNLRDGAVRLGDATREQVLEAADIRTAQAAGLARESARFRKCADTMRRRKVTTVGELPEDVVLEIFRGNDD